MGQGQRPGRVEASAVPRQHGRARAPRGLACAPRGRRRPPLSGHRAQGTACPAPAGGPWWGHLAQAWSRVGHGTPFRLMMIKGKPMGLQRKVSSPPGPARPSPRATPRGSVWPPVPPLEPAPPVLGWMLCPLISSPPGTSGRGLAWRRAFADVTRRQGPPGRGEH